MSTRSTIALDSWNEEKTFHLYKELLTGEYCLEDDRGGIIHIPERLVYKIAQAIDSSFDPNQKVI